MTLCCSTRALELTSPSLDKLTSILLKIPDDSYTAAFEENLCANLEGRVKEVHRETIRELTCKIEETLQVYSHGLTITKLCWN